MELENITKRIRNDLQYLERFTATPGNGCTRLPFTKEARGAVEYIKARMTDAGLLVHEDAAGNVFGVLKGEDEKAPCVMMGSHYDSVINGGNFDGIAGVVGAIETARQLKERGTALKRNFVAAGFCDEEGTRFGTGFFGSGAMLGSYDVEYCRKFKDSAGISVYDAMREYGLNAERLLEAMWEPKSIGYFIESHIEQGPVLDTERVELGLVDCIVGLQRYMVTISGRADHAGTTPMNMRKDAMEAAAQVIARIPEWARQLDEGTVATVGHINAMPGGINIVAEQVEFSVDIRSRNNEHIDRITEWMEEALEQAAKNCDVKYEIDSKLKITPVHLSEKLLRILEECCGRRGFTYKRMSSGAGHDALKIGQQIPAVIIFVASKDGRSHCPVEFSKYEDLTRAYVAATDLAERLLTE